MGYRRRKKIIQLEHDKLSQITRTVLSFFGHKKSEHGLEAEDKRETATAHGNGIRPRVDTKRNSNSIRGQKHKQARYIIRGGQSPQITTTETARKYTEENASR
jgi:hypothetical protein